MSEQAWHANSNVDAHACVHVPVTVCLLQRGSTSMRLALQGMGLPVTARARTANAALRLTSASIARTRQSALSAKALVPWHSGSIVGPRRRLTFRRPQSRMSAPDRTIAEALWPSTCWGNTSHQSSPASELARTPISDTELRTVASWWLAWFQPMDLPTPQHAHCTAFTKSSGRRRPRDEAQHLNAGHASTRLAGH